MEKQILVIVTLDTKENEALFLKECIESMGFRVVLMDTGILSPPNGGADISQDEVAERGGMSLKDAIGTGDKAKCTENMALGACLTGKRFKGSSGLEVHRDQRLDAALCKLCRLVFPA
jgi:uncharacterized protein (UPF0261 family)